MNSKYHLRSLTKIKNVSKKLILIASLITCTYKSNAQGFTHSNVINLNNSIQTLNNAVYNLSNSDECELRNILSNVNTTSLIKYNLMGNNPNILNIRTILDNQISVFTANNLNFQTINLHDFDSVLIDINGRPNMGCGPWAAQKAFCNRAEIIAATGCLSLGEPVQISICILTAVWAGMECKDLNDAEYPGCVVSIVNPIVPLNNTNPCE